jgi:hypothetical protein
MHILCERQGRNEEAERFANLARRSWPKAAPESIPAELEYLRTKVVLPTGESEPEKHANR